MKNKSKIYAILALGALGLLKFAISACEGPYVQYPGVYCPFVDWNKLYFPNAQATFLNATVTWVENSSQIVINPFKIELTDGNNTLSITPTSIILNTDKFELTTAGLTLNIPLTANSGASITSLTVTDSANINSLTVGTMTANDVVTFNNNVTFNSNVTVNGDQITIKKLTANPGSGNVYITTYYDSNSSNYYPAIELCYNGSCAYIYYDGNNLVLQNGQ